MAKAITRPIERVLKLEKWAPTAETYVTIRQATQDARAKLYEVYDGATQVVGDDGRVQEWKLSFRREKAKEVATRLTLVDCNIPDPDGHPLFRFKVATTGRPILDMTPPQFAEAWGQLPPELADEIYQKVLEVNPQWGPEGEG